jgi:penicillin amidase
MLRKLLVPLAFLPLLGCPGVEPEPEPTPNPLEVVPQSGGLALPCLTGPVDVVETEFGIPHIYATNDVDLACALGFVSARDRFFQMDLISRNGLGRLGELLGDEGFSTDVEIRGRGGRQIAQNILDGTTGVHREMIDAYAVGVNAYIDEVRARRLPAPAELELVYQLLGKDEPFDLMDDWTALNVAGVAATVNFVSGFETTDIKNQRVVDALETWGLDKLDGDLRHAGAWDDMWLAIRAPYAAASAPGFAGGRSIVDRRDMQSGPRVEQGVLDRAIATAERLDDRLIAPRTDPTWGSNTWAVAPELTTGGNSLVAGDGHLSLSVPGFLHHIHIDSQLLGGGDLHAIGLTVPGVPAIGLGHNGDVAWSHTSQTSDINDYYRDEVVVGGDGKPSATLFRGEEQPIEYIDETYSVSDALGSTPGERSVAWMRTAQGRPFFSLEGTEVDEGTAGAVNVMGDWIVAEDVDGDGAITAITGAATHYSEQHMIEHVMGWNKAADVDEWWSHHQGMTSYSQHFVVGDTGGNILYSGFQGMPCRSYLPRDADGIPVPGAHPGLIIDGTEHPSFRIGYDGQRRIDPAKDDEVACALSPEEYPHSKNPEQGYLVNSNNDPWPAAFDNDLWNDPYYIGGPWAGTFRARRIIELIEEGAGAHSADSMAAIQGDHQSSMGREFDWVLLEAMDLAEAAALDGALDGVDGRIAALWTGNTARFEQVRTRLQAWADGGWHAASGVEMLWNQPTEQDRQDAIATMIHNAWVGRFAGRVFNDEGLPGVFRPYGGWARMKTLKAFVDNEMPDGSVPASYDAERGESVFFDDLNTPEVENRYEIALLALVEALDYLATEPGGDRSGGFNTDDMEQWLWGLKHFVRFRSFVASEIGDDPLIEGVFEDVSITPEQIPLDDPPPTFGDPRRGLPGFPRPGDAFGIDAAGGVGTTNFSYTSGPVMRMAVELEPGNVHGLNVIPGGQSANLDSDHFADQAELWIKNEAFPIRFYVDDVIANAVGRERFTAPE